jgi:hypothetical protein
MEIAAKSKAALVEELSGLSLPTSHKNREMVLVTDLIAEPGQGTEIYLSFYEPTAIAADPNLKDNSDLRSINFVWCL